MVIILLQVETENMERWTNLEYIEEEMKKRTLGKEKAGSTRGNRKDQKHI